MKRCQYIENSNKPCEMCPRRITALYACNLLQEIAKEKEPLRPLGDFEKVFKKNEIIEIKKLKKYTYYQLRPFSSVGVNYFDWAVTLETDEEIQVDDILMLSLDIYKTIKTDKTTKIYLLPKI